MKDNKFSYAGFLSRYLAFFVDSFFILVINLILLTIIGKNLFLSILKLNSYEEMTKYMNNYEFFLNYFLVLIILILVISIYFVFFWLNSNGFTPGKKIMAIRIQKLNNRKINFKDAVIRLFGYFLSSLGLYLGFYWIMWDKKKQGWHDKLAKTIVVKTGQKPKIKLAAALVILFYFFLFSYYVILFGRAMLNMRSHLMF